ncbi:MAG: acyl-CoA dehydrogenase [Deltaproteobacteria bacterium]|nr:MAG: acyl-CoA dehydrogenase [Deltaproteobacteria bacterium]
MSSTEFSVDLEDVKFVLFDQLDIDTDLKAIAKYEDFDQDLYDTMVEEAARIAQEVLGPLNGPGDRQGCKLDGDGNVTTPEGYQNAWKVQAEGGWIGLNAPVEVGGAGLPLSVAMACIEMFSGACMAFQMYPGLTAAAARVLAAHGPEGKGPEYATKMFTGEWGGTMCLTEAGAGSSVGDNRCKAVPIEDEPGAYLLEGEKIFISGGDHDLADNIVHLVLAKTPGAPEGTKGISLFVVPKFITGPDLELGERNGAYVVGIEEKMGIHGNATCTLALGDRAPCKGWIVGQEGQGMALMFLMMNEARIGVGAQGLSIGAAAFNFARAYAKERVQGTSLKDMRDGNAPRVTINKHPDVRRMLLWQKCHVEAMRSLLFRMAHKSDLADNTDDEALKEKLEGQVDLLTPICKAHCTDIGFDVAVSAVQVYGGYGFISEYPVEQLVRDGKIMTIYEGTNGIQALDLLGRKMRIKGGKLFMDWMAECKADLAAGAGLGLDDQAAAIGKAIDNAGAVAMHLAQVGMTGNLDGAMLHAVPFQRMMGITQLAVESFYQAVAAKRKMDASGETNFLKGKLLNLKFYTANVLPEAIALAKAIRTADESPLDDVLFN